MTEALAAARPALLFGLRLWASVCLALYIAFWLQLDNAFWAGTSAAIVSQPQLGASLRKGWFRLVGTLVGAVMIVVLTALFPQERVAFLVTLALWGAVCAFASTVLRNFASYAAALAGYTAAIIAADTLGATGGPDSNVFMLAVMRASEICIGIVSAGIVLAGTDLGAARRQLAEQFAALGAEIAHRFTSMLARPDREVPAAQPVRRELSRRVIALDPIIDQALGEASQLRYHSPTLQSALHGLFTALDGWRGVATRLGQLPDHRARQEIEAIRRRLPVELRRAPGPDAMARWLADPMGLNRSCEAAAHALHVLPTGTPSVRLLADQTGRLLKGIAHALVGVALLADAPGQPRHRDRGFKLSVPDWLPAAINAGRAFVMIGAVSLFWVVTAWPSGTLAIVFVAVVVLLLSPRGDVAYASAVAFTVGSAIGIPVAATVKFAVLPSLQTFPAFCLALGLVLVPVGFGIAHSQNPSLMAAFTALGFNFVPLLEPANQMTYDTVQFYNSALALFTGCALGALAFRLLPPPSPALRTRRLLAFALRDLRRSALAPLPPTAEGWERRMYGRLTAMPEQATPLQVAQLLAALAVGCELSRLRRIGAVLALGPDLNTALAALADGRSAVARTGLARLDQRLAAVAGADAAAPPALQARSHILAISEALAQHAAYFDSGAAP